MRIAPHDESLSAFSHLFEGFSFSSSSFDPGEGHGDEHEDAGDLEEDGDLDVLGEDAEYDAAQSDPEVNGGEEHSVRHSTTVIWCLG